VSVRLLVLLGICSALVAEPASAESELADAESRACQVCHGIPAWRINDPVTGEATLLSIDSEAYRLSSHGALPCRSCHARGYDQIPPHRGSPAQPIYLCVLCHQKDQDLAQFRLLERKAELQRSVHGDTVLGPLDCHTCHDPHRFRPVNDPDDPLSRIEKSNAICLGCHGPGGAEPTRFGQPDAAPFHARFPNYDNHVRKLKCVACHTTDTASNRHDIAPKQDAVSECAQCHTPASQILDAVYGPQRRGHGDRLVEDAYVIGSSRTPRLERLSLLGFATLLGAIALHGLARVVHALWQGGSGDG
jgi:hypothetical protein